MTSSEGMEGSGDVAVDVTDLSLWVGDQATGSPLSFRLRAGSILGIYGGPGTGKTALLRTLATLTPSAGGTVVVDGVDAADNPTAVRERVGFAPGQFGQFGDLTASEYLLFFAVCQGIEPRDRQRLTDDLLELTELSDCWDQPVDGLEPGEQRRLSLARCLLHDPAVLLLDEPDATIDPESRQTVLDLLSGLTGLGKAVIVTARSKDALVDYCDHTLFLGETRIPSTGAGL